MKSQKGIALITVIVLIVVIFSFALGLSVVVDKNLKFFSFTSQKSTAHSLAKAAMEYIRIKGISVIPTGEIQVDPNKPYYFEIREAGTDYHFIGIVKDSAGGRETARTVLRAPKSAASFKDAWTE